jgi:Ca2+-binding EF-hand superfamily protein
MVNLSSEDTKRYSELFKKLDLNSDGKIDVNDLVKVFEKNKNSKETSISRAQVYSIKHVFKKI